MKRRLDVELVRRGLVASRSEASELVEKRVVLVSGTVADKVSRLVGSDEAVEISGPRSPYVSRGGEKLAAALDAFDIIVTGRSVLDVGASTGGFTDCLLQRGSARVVAVDVGRDQMHEKISSDERVVRMDGVNARHLKSTDFPFVCSLVVGDLSFISLTKVVDVLVECAHPEPGFDTAELILLIKPQFEVGRAEASKGRGVISDPALHRSSIKAVSDALEQAGCSVLGVVESPIKGAEGNTEFLVYATKNSEMTR